MLSLRRRHTYSPCSLGLRRQVRKGESEKKKKTKKKGGEKDKLRKQHEQEAKQEGERRGRETAKEGEIGTRGDRETQKDEAGEREQRRERDGESAKAAPENLARVELAGLPKGLRQHRFEEIATGEFLLGHVHPLGKLSWIAVAAVYRTGAGLEWDRLAATGKTPGTADTARLAKDEVVGHAPRLSGLVVDDQELVWDVQDNVTLLRVTFLVQLDIFKLERKIVAC